MVPLLGCEGTTSGPARGLLAALPPSPGCVVFLLRLCSLLPSGRRMFSYSALHGTLKSLSLKVPLAVSLWAAHSLLSPSLHLQSDPLPCLHWLLLQAASGTCHPSKQPQSCSCFFFVLSLSPPAGPSVIIQPKASQENDFSVSFGKWDALSQSPH